MKLCHLLAKEHYICSQREMEVQEGGEMWRLKLLAVASEDLGGFLVGFCNSYLISREERVSAPGPLAGFERRERRLSN